LCWWTANLVNPSYPFRASEKLRAESWQLRASFSKIVRTMPHNWIDWVWLTFILLTSDFNQRYIGFSSAQQRSVLLSQSSRFERLQTTCWII